jgi:hypothetical protein
MRTKRNLLIKEPPMNTDKHGLKRGLPLIGFLKLVSVFICVCLWFPFMVGCGQSNPLGRVAVSGKITLDGHPLPPEGSIRFIPEKSSGIQTGAPVDANGEYHIENLKGLPPGKYRVQISSTEKPKAAPAIPGSGGMPPPAIERLPAKYNSDTTLTAEVSLAEPARFDFDLKTK